MAHLISGLFYLVVLLILTRLWAVVVARRIVDKTLVEEQLASLPLLAGRGSDEMRDVISACRGVVVKSARGSQVHVAAAVHWGGVMLFITLIFTVLAFLIERL